MELNKSEGGHKHLTIQQKQKLTNNQMVKMITDLYDLMHVVYYRGEQLIFTNPYGLTEAQVLEGFGSDAMELLRLAGIVRDCLNLAIPGSVPDDDDDPYK
jgi:hypothetical protein